jgi:hypothetical protein
MSQWIGYGLDDRGIGARFPAVAGRPVRFWGPPSLVLNDDSLPGGKSHIQLVFHIFMGPEREAELLPPSSAEVKNARSYTATPPYVFIA